MKKYKGAGIAIIKKQNDELFILLGKRTEKPQKGKWSIPGGGFEKYDKSLFETALREFREETRIDLSETINEKDALICDFHFPVFEWKTFIFEVNSDFPTPRKFCHEFSEMKFISINELKNFKLAFGVKKEIKTFLIKK